MLTIGAYLRRPIKQHASGKQGAYRTLLVEQKPLSLRDGFRPLAEAKENQPPATDCIEDLERHFWRNVTLNAPTYGADVDGTLFDKSCKARAAIVQLPPLWSFFFSNL